MAEDKRCNGHTYREGIILTCGVRCYSDPSRHPRFRNVINRDLNRLRHRYEGRCAYCKVAPGHTWDHVLPRSRGGRSTIGNLVPACDRCNDRKGQRLNIEHRVRPLTTRGRKFPPEVLTTADVKAILEQCGASRTGLRNKALIILMWRSGLRLDEALSLRPKDLSRNEIRVLHGKGDKARTVGIDHMALREINEWVDVRKSLNLERDATLFCTIQGGKLSPSYVRDMLKRLATRAGIDKRVHPHGFRHTHAYELMMEGVPVNIIQRQLGHSNIATTSRYLDHIAPAEVINAIQERTW